MTEVLALPTGHPDEMLVFAADGSGWCRYVSPSMPATYRGGIHPDMAAAYVRLGQAAAGGPFVVTDIHVRVFPGTSGTRAVRELPLGRIEATANTPDNHATLVGAIHAEPAMVPVSEELTDPTSWPWLEYGVRRPRAPRLRLKVPDGPRKPDQFYQQVADRFAYLSLVSARPAADLAEANDVPPTTIHGWVKEARRRGFLVSGERTKRGVTP